MQPAVPRAAAHGPESPEDQKPSNITHVAIDPQVELEACDADVQPEVIVDGEAPERYVAGNSGNQGIASSVFFIGDLGSVQPLHTDVTATNREERCSALDERSDSRQVARHIFAPPEFHGRHWADSPLVSVRRSVGERLAIAAIISISLLSGLVLASSPASAGEYEVQPGDSLWSIAQELDTSIAALRELNEIEGDLLRVGQRLRVPGAPYDGPSVTHEIRSGEALSTIAERYGVSVAAVLELNDITNPNRIRVGDRLEIPTTPVEIDEEITITVRHRIVTGDSLGSISAEYGVRLAAIMASNGLSNPDLIRVGDVLVIENVVPRTETERLTAIFEQAAETYELDPFLLKAVGWQESRWQADALSSAGARGIGQIMPGTHTYIAESLMGLDADNLDPWDPADNITMSARYIRYLLDHVDDDVRLALASYYQGPGSVRQRGLYGETEDYVASVLRFREGFVEGNLPLAAS